MGKRIKSATSIGTLHFQLGDKQTSSTFRVLPLGTYDGILGMDWLSQNNALLHCKDALLTFQDSCGKKVIISGIRRKPKLHLVTVTKLLKGYCKKQMVYAVKLNPIEKAFEHPLPASLFDLKIFSLKSLPSYHLHVKLIMLSSFSPELNLLPKDPIKC